MTHKTTKTIADLDIDWTFHNPIFDTNWVKETKQYKDFCELNPKIHNLAITPNYNYEFHFGNEIFKCGSYSYETLGEYFFHVNQAFWFKFRKEVKLKKFERISDTKYIIHGK